MNNLISELSKFAEMQELVAKQCESLPLSQLDDEAETDKEMNKKAADYHRRRGFIARKSIDAILLLAECKDHLLHTKCISDDATQCHACSIEARIDSILGHTSQP